MSKRKYTAPRNAAPQKQNLSKRDAALISKIVYQFQSRTRVDIDKWREAAAQAEQERYPRRTKWAGIVKDLDLDAHWTSQILIRSLSVLSKPFKVVDKKTREEILEKTQLFQAPWFYYLLTLRLHAHFTGTKAVEVQDLIEGNYRKNALYEIPQINLAPEEKLILLKATDSFGYNYAEDPYVLEFEEGTFMGILYKAAPYIIFKKNALQSWAEFGEKFGVPMRYITTNKQDKATLDRLETMLDKLGSAAKAILPEGTKLDFKEADTADAFQVFDKMIERCNSEISKLVNAVTMISDNGSSLSQSQVHEKINQKVIDADAASLQGSIQWDILPQLQKLGFPFDPLKEEWVWDDNEVLSKGALWNIVQGILKFYEVDETWLTEKFGVPLTGKRAAPIMDNQSGGNIPNNAATLIDLINDISGGSMPKNTQELADLILKASAKHTESFNTARQSAAPAGRRFDHAAYTKMLKAHSSPSPSERGLGGEVQNSIDSLFLKAAKAFFDNPSNKPSTLSSGEWNDLYKEVSEKLWGGVQGAYKDAANADLDSIDQDMLDALQKNMYIFSSFKNFNLMLALNGELKDENGKLREWADFKTRALALNEEYNVNWLQTEYNTAVASAQGAAKWQQFWNERKDYNLKFQTVGDKRVRDEHQLLDGIVLPVDDAWWNTHYPPLGFNCRCEAIQVAKSEAVTEKGKIAAVDVPKMFQNNVGKTGQVFTKDHPYWSGLTTTEKNALEKLATKTIDDKE